MWYSRLLGAACWYCARMLLVPVDRALEREPLVDSKEAESMYDR